MRLRRAQHLLRRLPSGVSKLEWRLIEVRRGGLLLLVQHAFVKFLSRVGVVAERFLRHQVGLSDHSWLGFGLHAPLAWHFPVWQPLVLAHEEHLSPLLLLR